jgi:hypothetical protein
MATSDVGHSFRTCSATSEVPSAPVGLFSRWRALRGDRATPGAFALVKASTRATDYESDVGVHRDHRVRDNELNALNLGSIPHNLTLEVTVPGHTPFEVTREFKVPARATGRSGYTLPPGLRLPVVVRDVATLDIDVDWGAFLASPDRKAAVRRASAERSSAEAKRYTESVPGMKEQTWASAAQGLPMWMASVRSGSMKRKQFDQQLDTLLRLGQMDPALADDAKRTLDAEGF